MSIKETIAFTYDYKGTIQGGRSGDHNGFQLFREKTPEEIARDKPFFDAVEIYLRSIGLKSMDEIIKEYNEKVEVYNDSLK